VNGGKFEAEIPLKEDLLLSTLTDQESTFGPLETISNTVTACAQVRPNEEGEGPQPKNVQEVLGDEGTNLQSSPQIAKFGDSYRLEVLTSTELPSPSLAAIENQVGKVKTITDKAEDLFCAS
jgi:hypothetical protein